MVTLPDFTPLQGGVPLVVDGEVVGAIGVSGAASAQEDEEFAKIAAAALHSNPREVSYIEGTNVKAAFAKGMPLIEVGEYKIHASRREGPGQAEIHERDTDIVHVLSGAATLVTGGRATGSKTIGPEEVRCESIEGGQRRRLAPGDVVVIPNGVPHQFLEVDAPLQYYVVKVRI
jgi:glc operon protein GlcG